MLDLGSWKNAIETELIGNILPWWQKTLDPAGGWAGYIDNKGQAKAAPRGIVMHARFLWTYSLAFRRYNNPDYLKIAQHALAYMHTHLADKVNGGYHWMIDNGQPTVPHKVVYGQAFALYSLSEYYRASQDPAIKTEALALFDKIQTYAFDPVDGGYFEAVSSDWKTVVVNSLSDSDIACDKSMNTNLHVMEAFTALLLATGDQKVKKALSDLLTVHLNHIRTSPAHFGLYFNKDWKSLNEIKSYGHDIEGSWLMYEAAEAIYGHHVPTEISEAVLIMARKTLEIVKQYGPGLINEEEHNHVDKTLIWWVQAECCVGLFNAYQLEKKSEWLEAAQGVWQLIMEKIKDPLDGEWFWGRNPDGSVMKYPKGGLWKTSYHNGRACMELISRIDIIK